MASGLRQEPVAEQVSPVFRRGGSCTLPHSRQSALIVPQREATRASPTRSHAGHQGFVGAVREPPERCHAARRHDGQRCTKSPCRRRAAAGEGGSGGEPFCRERYWRTAKHRHRRGGKQAPNFDEHKSSWKGYGENLLPKKVSPGLLMYLGVG